MERLCRYHQHLIMRILNKQHVLAKYLYGVSSRHKEIDFRSKKILSNAILKVHLLNLNRMIGASPVVNQSLCHSDAGRAQHATSAVNEFLHCGRSGPFNFAARLHRLQLALSRSFSTSSRNRSSGRPDGDEEENKEEEDKDCLQNFQNHILAYAAKRFAYSYDGYKARCYLAAIDYNEHLNRPAMTNKSGDVIYHRQFSKKAGHWTVTQVKEPKGFLYMEGLVSKVIQRTEIMTLRNPAPEKPMDDPSRIEPTIAPIHPPATADIVKEKEKHSRFKD